MAEAAHYEAFGDESITNALAAYALGFIPATRESRLIRALRAIKRSRRVPPDSVIHCTDLFWEADRAKTDWSHLSTDEISQIILSVCEFSRSIGMKFSIGIAEIQRYQLYIGTRVDPKYLAAMAFGAAVTPLGPDAERMHLHVEPEMTRITLPFGDRLEVPAQAVYCMTDIGFAGLSFDGSPYLLELADIMAYVATHALPTPQLFPERRFELMYRTLSPVFTEFSWLPPDPGLAQTNYWHQRHEALIA